MTKKKLAIIGTNGLPGRYGGWDQLLNHLTSKLSDRYEIIVYTSKYNAVPGLKEFNNSRLTIIPLKANGVQSIFYDGISMLDAAFKYDILLVLGTSGCIFLPFIRLINNNIILNPDGAEWKRGKWNFFIKQFLKLSEYLGIRFSKYIISDNLIIQKHIDEMYKKKSFLIEYGGDQVIKKELSQTTELKYLISDKNYAFKVCRIEPENNIDLILNAFVHVELKLILIGNWNNSKYGINLKESFNNISNLILLDPIYDQDTLDELRSNCGIYIHGHTVGGTNPSLVEAMNLGLCCIVYDVNYNRVTTNDQAIYFKTQNDLINILKKFELQEIDTARIGNNLFKLANEKYQWNLIISKYDQVFKSIQ
jgi:glycosyltransferase involved in cell wall biosynthesis